MLAATRIAADEMTTNRAFERPWRGTTRGSLRVTADSDSLVETGGGDAMALRLGGAVS